jgi:hypothetical protein
VPADSRKDIAMSKRLPVPPELEHLIEKRETDADRRSGVRRENADRRDDDVGPLGAIESAESLEDVPTEERRSGEERRGGKDRRKARRRKP